MYKAQTIAHEILKRYQAIRVPLNHMAITKLVYLAHGWHLALTNEPLIDEDPEVWEYGPVIRSLWELLEHTHNKPLTHIESTGETVDEEVEKFLDVIVDKHKHVSAIQLANYCHLPESPYEIAKKQPKIGRQDLRDYFLKRIKAK